MLVLLDLALGFVAPHLLIERIEKLLSGGGAGERRTVVKCAAEATKIQQSFRSSVERHAHAVEQINDARSRFAHGFYGRLVGEEVTAVNRVIKMLPGGVALALQILGGIDSALGADRMRALYRNDGEQIHLPTHLRDLDNCRKPSQPAANNDDFRI